VVLERLSDALYPPSCLTCEEQITAQHGLCPSCWAQTPFIVDPPCEACGRPLMGDARAGDLCDDCLYERPAWDQGRAVFVYGGRARHLILRFKHGDRTELAVPAGRWLAQAAHDIFDDHVIVPVPLHWSRQLRRGYNQAALLSSQMSRVLGAEHAPRLLQRVRPTRRLDRLDGHTREIILKGNIRLRPNIAARVQGGSFLLVDDVMTTGATLRECARVLMQAGARRVSVVVLARVASWE